MERRGIEQKKKEKKERQFGGPERRIQKLPEKEKLPVARTWWDTLITAWNTAGDIRCRRRGWKGRRRPSTGLMQSLNNLHNVELDSATVKSSRSPWARQLMGKLTLNNGEHHEPRKSGKKKYKYSNPSYVDKHSEHVGQITSVRMMPPRVCHSFRKEELRVKTFPQDEKQASMTGWGLSVISCISDVSI